MKQCCCRERRRALRGVCRERSGFTLVELMTVIAIIGLLSAFSVTIVRSSIESAKETQTRTTIAKIDNVLTTAYEKYQYRRVDLTNYYRDFIQENHRNPALAEKTQFRIGKLRDKLRCDFPCTPEELGLSSVPSFENGASHSDYPDSPKYTPIQWAIVKAIETAAAGGTLSSLPYEEESPAGTVEYRFVANAELLYLVIMNADPEARSLFSEREVADVDGNGLKEFVDGWGKPICWARWAPSLPRSDRQPSIDSILDQINANGALSKYDADPFDPLGFGYRGEVGWFLIPYVFSAGPDGIYGLNMPGMDGDPNWTNVDFVNDPFAGCTSGGSWAPVCYALVGQEINKSYKDNIDNHTLVR